MPYEIPSASFNALNHATNKIIRANQFQELVIAQFKSAYEDFWGVDPVQGGSRYTTQQMQQILDAMPMQAAIDILTDAAEFKTYVNAAYPGQLEARYHESAWNYTIGQNGITLTTLKAEWDVQPDHQ